MADDPGRGQGALRRSGSTRRVISDPDWAEQHWKTLAARTTRRRRTSTTTGTASRSSTQALTDPRLSAINRTFLEAICERARDRDEALAGRPTTKPRDRRPSGWSASAARRARRVPLGSERARLHRRAPVRGGRHRARVHGLLGLPRVPAAVPAVRPRRHGPRPALQHRPGGAAVHEELRARDAPV